MVVIGYRYWQSRFSASPSVIGRTVKINGYPFTIIGVAPASFSGTELIVSSDYWVPMSMELQIESSNDWLYSRNAQNIWALARPEAWSLSRTGRIGSGPN